MNELMVHIEKAVRPLPAPQSRRREIREELLSHLQGIYDEELERPGDRDSALRAAIERFGPADELSRRLQASLPWYTVVLSRIPLFAPVRNWPLSVFRVSLDAWLTGVLCWLLVGVPWCLLLVSSGRYSAAGAVLLWTLFALAGAVLLVPAIGMIGALHGVYRQPKSARRAWLFGIGQYLLLVALSVGLAILKSAGVPPFSMLDCFAPAAVPILIAMMASTRAVGRAIQIDEDRGTRTNEWEQLELS